MKRKHLVVFFDTLEYLGLEGAAWVVSGVVSFLEDDFWFWEKVELQHSPQLLFVAGPDSCLS